MKTPEKGKAFLYRILELIRGMEDDKINLARLAYTLARLEEALKKDTGVVSSGTAEDTLEDEELAKIEQTRSLEEMLRQIKEKDQREVEKVLKQKEDTADLKVIKNQTNDKTIDSKSKAKQSRSDIVDEKKSDRIATILNYVIIFLVVVFIGLCGMIGYQLFF